MKELSFKGCGDRCKDRSER